MTRVAIIAAMPGELKPFLNAMRRKAGRTRGAAMFICGD